MDAKKTFHAIGMDDFLAAVDAFESSGTLSPKNQVRWGARTLSAGLYHLPVADESALAHEIGKLSTPPVYLHPLPDCAIQGASAGHYYVEHEGVVSALLDGLVPIGFSVFVITSAYALRPDPVVSTGGKLSYALEMLKSKLCEYKSLGVICILVDAEQDGIKHESSRILRQYSSETLY